MTTQGHEGFIGDLERRTPHEPEYVQAVREVYESLWPFVERNPRYRRDGLLERLVEADRVIQFRVTWVDDGGEVRVNRGFRVQHSMAIGPYKGGLRFHPSVNASVLKFLAFEQTFKNALTTLPMGGGKGGSDFDPKGKSDAEVMRFCQAFAVELFRHVGPYTDVPAGDIGVGGREIGYLVGMTKRLTNDASAVFTGRGSSFGGSELRPEATGYGLLYFLERMLGRRGDILDRMRVSVSGSGNVATYAIEKAMEMGGLVVTASDSSGSVHDPEGFTSDKLAVLRRVKEKERGRIDAYAAEVGVEFRPGRTPWDVPVDVALPCATENELDADDARQLIANGVRYVAEGANMPTTRGAVTAFRDAGVVHAPGKASNAGGVAVSGMEMSQAAQHASWTAADVDRRLRSVMESIHDACVHHAPERDRVDYFDGANIAGFVKVADAMIAQGVV
ncbi:MAG: NADP-specific glutamate dehydrogenase [Thermoleophilia bacterium]|nr:NADP-specific glutamate dehydrogenase [Thermoleophilia bacterium]